MSGMRLAAERHASCVDGRSSGVQLHGGWLAGDALRVKVWQKVPGAFAVC